MKESRQVEAGICRGRDNKEYSGIIKGCEKSPEIYDFSHSLFTYILAAICRATYTPLAEAWEREWVTPLPSPIM